MKHGKDLEFIKRLVSGGSHVPPSVELLKSELRSDSGLEPTLPPPPSAIVYVIIKWKFHIRFCHLDRFHGFLRDHEEKIIADVKDLKVGAAYLGTYAELPRCNLHQTFWSYETLGAIDQFKSTLAKQKQSELFKGLRQLVSFIEDPTMGMHRLVRASSLAGLVTSQREKDPILDLFAGGN